MLIQLFTSLCDQLKLEGNERRVVRSLLRMTLKLSTYSQESSAIHATVGKENACAVHKAWISWKTNRDLHCGAWRGVYHYIATSNIERASIHGHVSSADILYAIDNLNRSDIAQIKRSALDWKSKPISQMKIDKVLVACKSAIDFYTYKMKFLMLSDESLTKEDIRQMFVMEALTLILRYESQRNLVHVIATVKRGLKSAWSEMCTFYTREKRDQVMRDRTTDASAKARKQTTAMKQEPDDISRRLSDMHYSCGSLREQLTIRDESNTESENPALASKCVDIEGKLVTKNIIEYMLQTVPRYGQYLSIVVMEDEPNRKFHKWLRRGNKTAKELDSLCKHAKSFCRVRPVDEKRALRILQREYGGSFSLA